MKFSVPIHARSNVQDNTDFWLVSYDPDTQCYTDEYGKILYEDDVCISSDSCIFEKWAMCGNCIAFIVNYDARTLKYKCLIQEPNFDRDVRWVCEKHLYISSYISNFPQQPGVEKPKTPLERLMDMRDELDSIIKELGEC